MKKGSVLVLVSGGLDSSVLLAELSGKYKKVWPIYIRQGLVWENIELVWLRKFIRRLHAKTLQPLKVLSLPMADLYGAHWSTGRKQAPGAHTRDEAVYLPGRNMALSLKAAVYGSMYGIRVLAMGSLDHNPFPDAAPSFYRMWGKALSLGLGKPIEVIAPYRHLSKVQVIRRGENLPLELSFSCIAPRAMLHCGQCNKCAERRRAFVLSGVKDPTHYAQN